MSTLTHFVFYRLLFLLWLIAWVLVSPLFHIHTLDVQEDRSLFALFLVHTVYSPDLPGEYSPPSSIDKAGTQNNQGSFSTHFAHYSEESLTSIIEDDSKWRKGMEAVPQLDFSAVEHFQAKSTQYVTPYLIFPQFIRLASLRAPPSVSV